jgi:penicillin-binding protein 1A
MNNLAQSDLIKTPVRWFEFWKAKARRTAVPDPTLDPAYHQATPLGGPQDDPTLPPPAPKRFWKKWGFWWRSVLALFLILFAWLAYTAPLSKSLEPIAPPRLTLLANDGEAIARNGAIVDRPVKAGTLPQHLKHAFLAIEDRRFYSHWGVDPRGFARALWANVSGSGMQQGGSTITQQFAKFTFLSSERSLSRKAREMLIAFWLEAWLTKDEILERYLSNVYFGDNVYGLRAASLHYFYRQPERLTLPQSIMLAGLVQAPSRLAPTRNYKGAEKRARLVMNAMVAAGFLSAAEAKTTPIATLDVRTKSTLPTGTYFADWAMPAARIATADTSGETQITTTLDTRLQRAARTAIGRSGLGASQVALVAMRRNGDVVAMIGGQSYSASSFNRATQARRQPGSTFKLIVYLAALQSGLTPDSMIDDSEMVTGLYRPKNSGNIYRGAITLREAFARSSNVAAVRLFEKLGSKAVIAAARDLGIRSPLAADPSLALGSSGITLLELTSAYASISANRWPVTPRAIPTEEPGFFESLTNPERRLDPRVHEGMLDLLGAVITQGTGRSAALRIKTYGKTGTSQDNRDALFVGFADDLIVGVWIGKDDNTPLKGISGGGLPARIWRDFMGLAIRGATPAPPAPKPKPAPIPVPDLPGLPDNFTFPIGIDDADVRGGDNPGVKFKTDIGGVKLDVDIGKQGIDIQPGERTR